MRISIFIFLLISADSNGFARPLESDSAFVSLITVLPGEAPEQLFGHSAFRVFDPQREIDLLYNYGTFQFGGLFVLKFLTGKLDYYLGVEAFSGSLKEYQLENRPVIEQRLNLTYTEQESVFSYLMANARTENRYYRYKFLEDNCTTRIPGVLEKVLHSNLIFSFIPDSNLTYRQSINTYFKGSPFLELAANILLGLPVDRQMNGHESLFLPINMLQAFDKASIAGPNAARRLVARKDTLFWVPQFHLKTALPWTSFMTWGLLIWGAYLTIHNYKRTPTANYFDFIFFGIVGCLGILTVFLWISSDHQVMKPNLNLLWAWPTHIGVSTAFFNRRPSLLKKYFTATFLVCASIILTWFLLPQRIDIALFPVVLLMALRAFAVVRRIKAS